MRDNSVSKTRSGTWLSKKKKKHTQKNKNKSIKFKLTKKYMSN